MALQGSPFFDTRPTVHFALDNDSDSDSAADLTTARSSPLPQQLKTASTSRYSDNQPLVDDAATSSPSTRAAEGFYYPPKPLESIIPSREAAYDLDSDEVDPEEVDASEPLLMEGLLQSGARRGSLDLRREGRAKELEDGEGRETPDWLSKGAGIFGGVANMSNSILGAGIVGELGTSLYWCGGANGACRTAVRAEGGRFLHGSPTSRCAGLRHGLDDPPDRYQRQDEWEEDVHRYHGRLLWSQGPRRRVLLPVRIRFRRRSRLCLRRRVQ